MKKNENPLLSISCNIFIPVMILKKGELWFDGYNHYLNLDPQPFSFLVALLFPLLYFIYDLFKRRNINFISILGFINVLLTGGIGIFGSKYGLTRSAFILKEGLMPIIIGSFLFLYSIYNKSSFNSIILNQALFNIEKIKIHTSKDSTVELDSLTKRAGYYFIAGFFISSIIQFILASIIVTSNPGDIGFNEQVSTMTWVSYFAVLIPTLIVVGKGYFVLIKGIEKKTGLKKEEFLNA